jgi:hypothetical protein
MTLNTEPRFRINTKQTAKNYWQLDVTGEYKSDYIEISNNPDDPGDTVRTHLGLQVLSLIKETERHFREDGRRMVGDDTKA